MVSYTEKPAFAPVSSKVVVLMLPNLIIIGAMKCGTTSLHFYLSRHPQVRMSRPKELNFFCADGSWSKGIDWYESHFNGDARIFGESSPSYSNFPIRPGVPARMHSVLPEAKLIYIVRDPIERIVSQYVHSLASGTEKRTFAEVVDAMDEVYVSRSQYFLQLQQYLEFFPESGILVIDHHELLEKRMETLAKVFRYLEVDDVFEHSFFSTVLHESRTKVKKNEIGSFFSAMPGMEILRKVAPRQHEAMESMISKHFGEEIERPRVAKEQQKRLVDCFFDDVNQLRNFSGLDLASWSV